MPLVLLSLGLKLIFLLIPDLKPSLLAKFCLVGTLLRLLLFPDFPEFPDFPNFPDFTDFTGFAQFFVIKQRVYRGKPGKCGKKGGFEGGGGILDFHDFLGGSKMEKNMKMQDEHGQILVSGALDPRKMIS